MPDVGCAGILVEDTFCGPMAALPREGALLALDHMPVRAGGCAANVAIDLARQGITVDVSGCVGRDAAANVVLSLFEAQGVGFSRVAHVAGEQTSKTPLCTNWRALRLSSGEMIVSASIHSIPTQSLRFWPHARRPTT